MSMEDDAMDDDYYAAAEADDEERELEAQNEAEDARRFILGSSAAAAIDVDGAGAGAGMGTGMRTRTESTSPTGTATASTSGNRSRRRGPTSKVWLDFEEVTEIHAGKEVRVSANASTARTLCLLNPLLKLSVLNGDYSRYPTSMRAKLTKMFQVYERKFGDAYLSNPILPGGASGMGTEEWGDIYGDEVAPGNGACVGTSSSSGLSELSSYLDSDTEVKFEPDFNILNWSSATRTYPILSILAKEKSPVLEERRRRLTPNMVEHTVEKESKEFEAAFEAMYLDDEGTSPGSKRKEQKGGNAADVGEEGQRTSK
ncbi:hypothetical protein U9M48_002039 [Paspalum notatum var. saurae]|uniref:Uncharacterized protein n=1 Tax=Paspalum notatum var. saurae TaxID=547442 RepID=A0AAQ3PH68_PASNO